MGDGIGIDYRVPMPPTRRTPQHTVAVDDELWRDCHAIAKIRREHVSAVIRAKLVDYRDTYRHLLDETGAATQD